MTTNNTRPTVASLTSEVAELKVALNEVLNFLTGQHSTSAPVAEAVVEATPKARKSTPKKASKKASKKVEPVVAPASKPAPEWLVRTITTKDDIRPLNKALDWKGDNVGKHATDRPAAEIKAALKAVEAEHGAEVALKALNAYKVRLAAAKARK